MKKIYHFLSLTCLLALGASVTKAQIVGTECFLQGRYLEVGVNNAGGFGACTSPATYHPHVCCGTATAFTPGGNLDAVYDWGHDGWSVGSPQLMGAYSIPGFPQEGWSVQVGPTEYRNGAWGGICAGSFAIPGGHTGYSNTGGRAIEYWNGNIAGLNIRAQTRVDTLASWVVITAVIKNTTLAPIAGVYYQRTLDPDNTSFWSGTPVTRNLIVHQNEDARHMVQVSAHGQTAASGTTPMYDSVNSYLALCTKDCRAKAFAISGLSPTTTAQNIYTSGTGATLSALNATNYADQGISLIYSLGTIPAGDSTIVSYAYIYNGRTGIDSAFPDPQIALNGLPRPMVAMPNPNYDTFDVCLYPGMTALPVDLLNVEDKCWSWSKWTWSPGLGLATTTGAHNVINTTVLPPTYTYTITGTDSAFGMTSCLNKVFYLTIHTCNGAEANSPCEGDTLWLNAPGDSVAATYKWYGPAPSTSVFATTQKAFIYPATAANNGMYSVIKTVAGMPDTSMTLVTIHHKPTVWASSNAPLCLGAANTLMLTSVCDSPSVVFAWSKVPPFFSSSLQNPSISGFSITDTGMYSVVVTSVFGCKDTDQVHVTLAPIPPPPVVTAFTPYCQNDLFVPFTISGVVPGGSVLWYGSYTGGVGSGTPPTVNTAVAGTSKFFFSQIIGSCEGPRDSIVIVVNPLPAPIVGPGELCQYFTINLTNTSTPGVWSSSNPGVATIDGGGLVTGVTGGTVVISYTLMTTCRRTTVVTVHPKPAPPTFGIHRECQYVMGNAATATGTNLRWYGLGVTPPSLIAPTPNTDTLPGIYNYYVTQTSVYGCVSDSALYPVRIYPEPAPPVVADLEYCQKSDPPALTAIGSNLLWYTSATSSPGSSMAPVPSTGSPGVTTYYVTQTVDQCESHRAPLNVNILFLPDFKILADKPWVCQFDSVGLHYDGPLMQDPGYTWYLPVGASFVNGTNATMPNVEVKFDTARGAHYIYLVATDYNGKCSAVDTTRIKVVPAPDASMYIKPDICLGDSITLALADRSVNSYKFTWLIDGIPMGSNTNIDIVTASSNSGGPFIISFHDKGRHILNVQGATEEGCMSIPTQDTVHVHALPDARFDLKFGPKRLCMEDSVLFAAMTPDYTCIYKWEPEHSFDNDNRPEIWGRVEQIRSLIKLTVTDPYGCKADYSREFHPETCCTVTLPNAFTPNGDGHNDVFRPLFDGFHRFHIFRITNRWGQTVFECANTNPSWNGFYNGVKQDLGVYFYYIKYDCGGKTIEAKGDITLIR